MLTRRTFNTSLAALALASLTNRSALAASRQGLGDAAFLNRLSFGATPESLAELSKLGREGWLEKQLSLPARDAGLDERLGRCRLHIEYEAGEDENGNRWDAVSEDRPLHYLHAKPADLVPLLDWERGMDYAERARPMAEVIQASIVRAVHAPAQLREVMTQFWHNHFNVYADKDETIAALFPPYDAGLREHALGNFRALLGHVAKSPAMLHYLNNDNSRASPANENYARELLELHTLGAEHYFNDRYESWHEVPGAEAGQAIGYIDDDVYEVARALTGWSIGDGRWLSDNLNAPMTGDFHYVEIWHDPYQKRVLGHELPAFAGPLEDGEKVLDILATHPGTARFVSRKMLRALGIEAPSEGYLQQVAERFLAEAEAPDQIARVIREIALHPEFAATPPMKLRRPFEFLAGLYRAAGSDVAPQGDGFYYLLELAGWTQHLVHPPTGHSDSTEDWADTRTINGLINIALESHADWVEAAPEGLRSPEGARSLGDLARYWAGRFGIDPAPLEDAIRAHDASPRDPLPEDDGDVEYANAVLLSVAALGPEFLFR